VKPFAVKCANNKSGTRRLYFRFASRIWEQFLLSLEDAIEKLVRFLDGQIALYSVSVRRLPAHIITTMTACALERMFMTHLIFGLAMNRVTSKFVEGKDFVSHWTTS